MEIAYVVLYVHDPEASYNFWINTVGMIEKSHKQAGTFKIIQVGFADQSFNLELVPRELMKDNPHGIDLATPSMALRVDDLNSTLELLQSRGVETSDIAEMGGVASFAFSDNEGRWFAVLTA
jgi:lactoylglutathione lyase